MQTNRRYSDFRFGPTIDHDPRPARRGVTLSREWVVFLLGILLGAIVF